MNMPDPSFGFDRIPDNLLRDPVEYIFADHFRMEFLCRLLMETAEKIRSPEPGSSDLPAKAAVILSFLKTDFRLHQEDEEADLFPALRVHAKPQDGIERVLEQLIAEHTAVDEIIFAIIDNLESVLRGEPPRDPLSFSREVTRLSEFQARHLKLENETVLSVSREQLTEEELSRIGRNMAARRGITYPA